MTDRLTLSIEECAKLLGIGRGLAYNLARTGQIPVIRLGRRLLVPRAQLEAMLRDPLWDPTERNDREPDPATESAGAGRASVRYSNL